MNQMYQRGLETRIGLLVATAVALLTLVGSAVAGPPNGVDAAAPGTAFRYGGSVATFFPGVTYDPAIPTAASVLGFELGSRPARYEEVARYLRALDDASPRAELHVFGQTYEGRPLQYLMIGSEENMKNAEKIRADIGRLANPPADGIVSGADDIIDKSPVIAWLGYSIHGDELSGVDAALWTAYYLLAANDPTAQKIRDNCLVLIDPSQNPDGRERFLSQMYMLAGQVENTDAQSLQHDGFWPWGRANHYLFDMNRDWLPLVLAESRARVPTILSWNPQLLVDAHEMGAFSSYLFSPGREPINPNITPTIRRWGDVFAADQGAEFDKRQWSYYTGDWNEEWYPGYGSSWAFFTGAVGILYEQAGVQGSSVKRYDGKTLSFSESVAHQAVSSLANLTTAANHRKELLSDFARFRRDAVTGAEKSLHGAFILAPGDNPGREYDFLATMRRHGLRIERATESFSANMQSSRGDKSSRRYPAGTYLIPLNQPLGVMAKTILDFDPHLSPSFLQEERREIEKGNGSRLYEISSWSLALGYDLDIGYAPTRPGVRVEPVSDPSAPRGAIEHPDAGFGYLIPVTDDRSMNALARILETGLHVRSTTKPFVHENVPYAAGTLLLRRSENPDDLKQRLADIAQQTGARIVGTSSGYSSAGPDLGSDYFGSLIPPRIGLFMGAGVDFTSCGWLWHLLDNDLRVRESLLDITGLWRYDLSAYNVLIIPSYWGGASGLRDQLGQSGIQKLKDWVKAGGTLIGIGEAAYFCADSSSGLSSAREKGSVLDKLAEYDQNYAEQLAAFTATVDTAAIWQGKPKEKPKAPAKGESQPGKPDMEALKRLDQKAQDFGPIGVIVKLDLNPEHWLNFGAAAQGADSTRLATVAILYTRRALVAQDPLEVPARVADAEQMRLAGLLWPEARQRWAKTAYATREGMGKGQVILFSEDPYFRAYFHGTKRLFLNAVLLGPGMGTSQPAPW
jgi:hypothetical protein